MVEELKFLNVRLRAMAQATEVEDRVLKAVAFASGTDEITVSRAEGHFGNPIMIFEAELKKKSEITKFIGLMSGAGILQALRDESDARTDQDCAFHFRLDKQNAYLGELALAEGKDVIDVRMKIGVYPARRAEAVRAVSEWLGQIA
jgi:RNA binding exosome subunit